jgi:hypothetical protein
MTSMFAVLMLVAAVDPSGHWEGTLDAPSTPVAFQVDFARTGAGVLAGAITIPAQHIIGLPLTKVSVDGASITFGAREDQLLAGEIEGASMSGTFTMGPMSIPFTLTRTGDAKLEPAPTSPRIGAELEGTWDGTLDDTAAAMHLRLTMTNQADGRATATMINLDEGGLQIPLAISRDASTITLESRAVPGTFTGTLNAAGELEGTFQQGAFSVPLTFRRSK